VANAHLRGCIKSTAHINTHDESLRWGETTTAVKELAKGAAAEALAHYEHMTLAIKSDLAMVED
jgi:hypothetical protein